MPIPPEMRINNYNVTVTGFTDAYNRSSTREIDGRDKVKFKQEWTDGNGEKHTAERETTVDEFLKSYAGSGNSGITKESQKKLLGDIQQMARGTYKTIDFSTTLKGRFFAEKK
jgi:hypothetical protein